MKRIAIMADNSVFYLEKVIEIWNSNNCVVLVDKRIPAKKAIELIQMANVTLCYTDNAEVARLAKQVGIISHYFAVKNKDMEIVPTKIYLDYFQNHSDTEALVIFSSGTTGNNKGIVLSHKTITDNAAISAKYKKLNENSWLYIYKSLAHSSAIISEFLACLISRARIIIASTGLTIRKHFKNIDENGITVVGFSPSIIRFIIKNRINKIYNFNSLKFIISSGAVLSECIHQKAMETLNVKIINAYGLTEAGPLLTMQDTNQNIIYCSVGKPIVNVVIEIRSENGDLQPINKIGIIFAKTNMRMSYYINKKDPYCKGWINTNDIGYIDEVGNLYVLGRYDNMIVSGTHNIYPESIEKIILDVDEVSECIVYGKEDETYGMIIICSCVVKSRNHAGIRKKILQICKENLASFEIPHQFLFVDNIDYTYSGKIKRKKEVEAK